MLTCRQVTEICTQYLEGQLSFGRRMRFRLHIGMCRHCRAYLRQMKATVRCLGRLVDEPLPPGVRDELIERFSSLRSGWRSP